MCDDKLLKLQWRIFRLWLEKECLGPGSVFLSPLKIRLSNLVNENLGHMTVQLVKNWLNYWKRLEIWHRILRNIKISSIEWNMTDEKITNTAKIRRSNSNVKKYLTMNRKIWTKTYSKHSFLTVPSSTLLVFRHYMRKPVCWSAKPIVSVASTGTNKR